MRRRRLKVFEMATYGAYQVIKGSRMVQKAHKSDFSFQQFLRKKIIHIHEVVRIIFLNGRLIHFSIEIIAKDKCASTHLRKSERTHTFSDLTEFSFC